jgi:RecB family exonuclease
VVASDAAARLEVAAAWLAAYPADAEVLVVAFTWAACDDLVREVTVRAGARFGITRLTLDRVAARLAAPALARAGRTPATALALDAVAARVVHQLGAGAVLSHFAPVVDQPGFAPAVARTLAEVRLGAVSARTLGKLERVGADLAALATGLERELVAAGLADRAGVLHAAAAAAAGDPPPPLAGQPLLLLDLALEGEADTALIAALAARAPAVLATVPRGDERTLARCEAALRCRAETLPGRAGGSSLAALQEHLFEETLPPPAPLDTSLTLGSAPGEARECVEIARRIQAEAAAGVAFDRMAIFLHAPGEYLVHLEEALRRADVPAFFARGTQRPHPAGRALLALLACAAEKLSARRFAEYLSLAQVPEPDRPWTADHAWEAPEDDLLAVAVVATREADAGASPLLPDPEAAAVVDGTLQAPWRWEQLLVDAAVIGTSERWRRRLAGLAAEQAQRRAAIDDGDEARVALAERTLRDVEHLRDFALPLIERLEALPARAPWGVWIEELRALAVAALRVPAPVLATLAEMEPMAPVGPVDLAEVQLVLGPRLRELTVEPPRRRYGAVFVAPAASARGLAFDVVFVPGLAERLFPRKIVEDPILPDAARAALAGGALVTQSARTAAERLALRLAVGAARRRVHLSYPRLDLEQGRPRVPSFYALEALRAAEGRLPGFEELAGRAEAQSGARLGWPAPAVPAEAIDEAEYDLALLAPLLTSDVAAAAGSATYLLGANVHLARALRGRARRWLRRWTPADGLVAPDADAQAALAAHQLAARSFSPTALQHFAACPYRFLLQAIHRLAPREEPVAIETLDPLTRGGLVHDAQFEALTSLRSHGLLPVRAASLERALALADEALDTAAARYEEQLAPAIARVWQEAVSGIRADLHEWLRRQALDDNGWVPLRFELSFGLAGRERPHADPASVPDPVPIAGGLRLRGAIDLVERHARGVLRVTDYKTGKVRAPTGFVVGGGEILQPLLYALAVAHASREPVEAGRLYYCTSDGGYQERAVALDEHSRAAVADVVAIVDAALRDGFFPAAPRARACEYCDYRPVCGPHEEQRVQRKPADRLADLTRLRGMP